MNTLWQDMRFGLRQLLSKPGFAAIAVLSLGLGIGANTAIFSLVDAVLLRPLPFYDPGRLVMVWEDASRIGFPRNTPAPANYADWKAQNKVFEDMAALEWRNLNLTDEGEPGSGCVVVQAMLPAGARRRRQQSRLLVPADRLYAAATRLGQGADRMRAGHHFSS